MRRVATTAPGKRNEVLFWAVRRATEEGHGRELLDVLQVAGHTAGIKPREVAATMRSALRARVPA